jgi:histidinol-phosphatase
LAWGGPGANIGTVEADRQAISAPDLAPSHLQADLAVAHHLADVATDVALGYFGRANRSELKADGTPVGEADLAVDEALLACLAQLRPGDAVLSEESGIVGTASRRWIVDPIDGTVAFLAGTAHWGTHVALEQDGEVVLGVVTRPVLERRWWATRGGGAHRGRVRPDGLHEVTTLSTSTVGSMGTARLSGWWTEETTSFEALRGVGIWVESDYNDLLRVLEAEVEVMIVPGRVWDHAPFLVLLEEAGGSLKDPEGGRRLDVGAAVYTNRLVDNELEDLLRG